MWLLVRQPDANCKAIDPDHVFFECAECYWSAFFYRVMYQETYAQPRNLCTESAVPLEATRQGKVPRQERNGVFSVILGALKPSNLRHISPSPSHGP